MKQEPLVTRRERIEGIDKFGELLLFAADENFLLRVVIDERTLEVRDFKCSYPAPLNPEEYENGFIPNK